MDLQLIVVNYHTYPLLQQFIDSYEEFKPSINSSLLIYDVESTPEIHDIRRYGNELIRDAENCGYARACNYGTFLSGRARNFAFFNADTRFNNESCVDYCVDFLDSNDNVAVVGPLQYSSSGKTTHGGIFGSNEKPAFRHWNKPVSDSVRDNREAVTVSGSAYFVKGMVWREMRNCPVFRHAFPSAIGGFPDLPHGYEETLFSYHSRAHGYEVWYLGKAEMEHDWHQSSPVGSQSDKFKEGRERFRSFCRAHGIECD